MKRVLISIAWHRLWKRLPVRRSTVARFSSRVKAIGNNSFPVCIILVEGEERAFLLKRFVLSRWLNLHRVRHHTAKAWEKLEHCWQPNILMEL